MNEQIGKPCGCKWLKPADQGSWWQVVACPDHPMSFRPHDEVPE